MQPSLFDGVPAATRTHHLEQTLARELDVLRSWTSRPSAAVDWELEALLTTIGLLATELRTARGEETIPF